jgi:CDP-diacylglycerol--inositol 3-phosphatidyltransferase
LLTSFLQIILFVLCALNELFFIAIYLLSFSSPLLSPSLLNTDHSPTSTQPGSPAHPAPSTLFLNPWSAGALEACAGKQIINVIQLIKASRWLAEGDVEVRRQNAAVRKKKR